MTHDIFTPSLKAARLELNKFYQILPVRALEVYALPNGWSVKDLLGNLAAWDAYVVEVLGTNQEIEAQLNQALTTAAVEERDYAIYKEHQDWTWTEIEQEAQTAFETLIVTLQDLEDQAALSSLLKTLISQATLTRYQKYIPILQRWAKMQQQQRRI